MQEHMFPRSHHSWPLIVFYGEGEQWLGHALTDFFDRLTIIGLGTELCRIMREEGSDKGSDWHFGEPGHNYTLLYDFLFRHRRFEITSLFELGIGAGGSLRGWKRYFARAQIYGADIDPRKLFSEERISTFYVDQLQEREVDRLWRSLSDEHFDIVIDDGLHSFEANAKFFKTAFKKLKTNGYYFIEDISVDLGNLNRYHEFFTNSMESGVMIKIPHAINKWNNCLAIFCKASDHAG